MTGSENSTKTSATCSLSWYRLPARLPPVTDICVRLICPPVRARSWIHGEASRSPHTHRTCPSEGGGPRSCRRVLFRCAWLRRDAANGRLGRVSQCGGVPPSHRIEYVGKPWRLSAAARHDRAVPLRDSLSRSCSAG